MQDFICPLIIIIIADVDISEVALSMFEASSPLFEVASSFSA
jgi:hypothetical protein